MAILYSESRSPVNNKIMFLFSYTFVTQERTRPLQDTSTQSDGAKMAVDYCKPRAASLDAKGNIPLHRSIQREESSNKTHLRIAHDADKSQCDVHLQIGTWQ